VVVREHTKQTNADQSNKNLLLSPKALMNANPQLEIYAEDVKCAHGSTTGQIDWRICKRNYRIGSKQ
jgi:Fe-S cluster assembly protein SufD